VALSSADKMAIHQKLTGMNPDSLVLVAMDALGKCDDLACQQEVRAAGMSSMRKLIPTNVGEGGRTAAATGAGFATGLIRGLFGPLWGRVATLAPAAVGLTVGLASKDAGAKAIGFSVLSGTTAGEAGIEGHDIGAILRAKLMTDVRPQRVGERPKPVEHKDQKA